MRAVRASERNTTLGVPGGGRSDGAGVVASEVSGASAATGTLSPQCGQGVRRASGTSAMANTDRQNGHEEPTTDRSNGQSFSSTITSSLLNRIAFNIADQIYGENAQTSGRFVIDDTLLEFNRVNNQVVVEITNSTTGETTTIELPVTEF